MLKNILHYPQVEGTYFDRALSTVFSDNALWIAVQIEKQRKNSVAVIQKRKNKKDSSFIIIDSPGYCYRPTIIAQNNTIFVAWNEVDDNGWKIKCAYINEKSNKVENVETVFSSEKLCLPPSVTYYKNELWISFPAIENNNIRIKVVKKKGEKWEILDSVSKKGIDTFRPHISSNNNGVYLTWDQYNRETYEVVLSHFETNKFERIETLSCDKERWFCPKLLCFDNDVYLSWAVLKEVTDKLGIYDHFPFGMSAYLENDKLICINDPKNPVDKRITADFREGLLGSKRYLPYFGSRRKPSLVLSSEKDVWYLWEGRYENSANHHTGHLLGKKLNTNHCWEKTIIFHEGNFGYSVPQKFNCEDVPVAYLDGKEMDEQIIQSDFIHINKDNSFNVDNTKWDRWNNVSIEKPAKSKKKIRTHNKNYAVYWADTHCHSILSPDAEGEVDELIHFAKDIAGLDAVCIADNDSYHPKALTEAEWRIHQAYSDHFTKKGEFVVFPGYEFTYHRKDLDPDFNHRIVVYPKSGSKMFRRQDKESYTDKKLFEQLQGTEAMCYPHHTTYKIINHKLDWNVEICSSWRVCIEETDFTIKQLKNGHKFGFIGSSDTHRSVPGLGGALTGIYAEELTPESLFDAYKNRRTIATQGIFIYIDFRIGNFFIGDEGTIDCYPTIEAHIEAPDKIEFFEIVKDGESIYKKMPGKSNVDFSYKDTKVSAGNHFYFLKVKLIGDPSYNFDPKENSYRVFESKGGNYPFNFARARGVFAWTSPIWITKK